MRDAGPARLVLRLEFRARHPLSLAILKHRGHVGNGSKKRSRRMAARDIKERDEKWTASEGTSAGGGTAIELLPPSVASRNNFCDSVVLIKKGESRLLYFIASHSTQNRFRRRTKGMVLTVWDEV